MSKNRVNKIWLGQYDENSTKVQKKTLLKIHIPHSWIETF